MNWLRRLTTRLRNRHALDRRDETLNDLSRRVERIERAVDPDELPDRLRASVQLVSKRLNETTRDRRERANG